MRYNLIVPCGGKGVRCGLDYNKLFYKNKDGLMLIEKTLDLFLKDKNCKSNPQKPLPRSL